MYEVSNALIANWNVTNQIRRPSAVDIVCPHCARKVTYTLQWGGLADPFDYYEKTGLRL